MSNDYIIHYHAKEMSFLIYRFHNVELVRCMIQQGVKRVPLCCKDPRIQRI